MFCFFGTSKFCPDSKIGPAPKQPRRKNECETEDHALAQNVVILSTRVPRVYCASLLQQKQHIGGVGILKNKNCRDVQVGILYLVYMHIYIYINIPI